MDASGTAGTRHQNEESGNDNVQAKRRKVSTDAEPDTSVSLTAGTDTGRDSEKSTKPSEEKRTIRQVHSDSRFPLRKPRQEPIVPVMTPTSTDKLLSGIWRQIHSEIKWGQPNIVSTPLSFFLFFFFYMIF